MTKEIYYIVWQEGKYFVSQCLNVNVSSFGDSIDEAVANLKEAVELYFEDDPIVRVILHCLGKRRQVPLRALC